MLTQAERNKIHTYLNGAHCRHKPPIERRVSDVARAMQIVTKTRARALPSQTLSILSCFSPEVRGKSEGHNAIDEKLEHRASEQRTNRRRNSKIVDLHDVERMSFPAIGSILGITAGHANSLYLREKRLRQLENTIRQAKLTS
jgi:hypothetical protein